MNANVTRRFWKTVDVVPEGAGWTVTLDGRPVRTPAKAPLVLPSQALAAAIAAEWDAQETEVRPLSMPLTRAANVAIDRVSTFHAGVVAMLADYADSDLLCYRAEMPETLVRRQAEAWDPLLDWAEGEFQAPLMRVQGVMYAAQPKTSVDRLKAVVGAHDAYELTALHDLVTLSGSLVLGLAVAHRRLPAEEAWKLSRIDEDWQAEQWGQDAESLEAAREKRAAFLSAERLLTLRRTSA